MSKYKTVLVAVDLTQEAEQILEAADQIVQEHNADLHVLTAIRPLNYAYSGYEVISASQAYANFEPQARSAAQESLRKMCRPRHIKDDHIHISFGGPADVIKSEAESLNANLIVVGSHGRHGLGLLLGSTANGVLHGAPCDVLTVRIHNSA